MPFSDRERIPIVQFVFDSDDPQLQCLLNYSGRSALYLQIAKNS